MVKQPYYIAPEVLKRSYTEKCDIWSCGVLLFILLSGKPPFFGEADKDILDKVAEGKPYWKDQEWAGVSQEGRNLVESMLKVEPNKRINVFDALKHPWFSKHLLKLQLSTEKIEQYYKNILSFKIDSKFFFQHATLAYMVHHLTTPEDSKEIRQLFLLFDKKGEGKLYLNDIINGFKKYVPNMNERELTKTLRFLDQSKSGYIEIEEFFRACMDKKKLLTEAKLSTTFSLFTKDDNKNMSPSDFKQILGLQSKFSDKVWEQIIKTIDANGDNEVTL